MIKKRLLINTILSTALFCSGVTMAQDPLQNIDKARHPYLAEAQRLVAEANKNVITAQQGNKYNMQGHAQKARDLLVQVNAELKLAADAIDASNPGQ